VQNLSETRPRKLAQVHFEQIDCTQVPVVVTRMTQLSARKNSQLGFNEGSKFEGYERHSVGKFEVLNITRLA